MFIIRAAEFNEMLIVNILTKVIPIKILWSRSMQQHHDKYLQPSQTSVFLETQTGLKWLLIVMYQCIRESLQLNNWSTC